jgi:hypothetical protein
MTGKTGSSSDGLMHCQTLALPMNTIPFGSPTGLRYSFCCYLFLVKCLVATWAIANHVDIHMFYLGTETILPVRCSVTPLLARSWLLG